MTARYKFKDVKEIIEFTPEHLKGREITSFEYEQRLKIGYYRKSNTNWNYEVYTINDNSRLREVVVVFGSII